MKALKGSTPCMADHEWNILHGTVILLSQPVTCCFNSQFILILAFIKLFLVVLFTGCVTFAEILAQSSQSKGGKILS